MAKFRYVNTHFWDDGFVRKMPPGDKLLFLYLITNPCTTIAGAYEITLERMKFDTGMDDKRLRDAIERLTVAGKITYKDEWILVHNFIKNQSKTEKTITGIINVLNVCPNWVKDTLYKGHLCPPDYLNLNKTKTRTKWNVKVVEVFEEWKSVLNKKSSLDQKRHALLLDRLKDYSVEDLKLVPLGASKSDWHLGANPKHKKYLEISTLFRDNEQVDKFIDLARGPNIQISATQPVPVMSQEEMQAKFNEQHYNDRKPIVIQVAQ